MRNLFILIFGGLMSASAGTRSQTVTLHERDAPLEKLFHAIQHQSGYSIWFEQSLIEKMGTQSIDLEDASIEEAMQACCKGKPLAYSIVGKMVAVKGKTTVNGDAQPPKDLIGIVLNEKGEPMAGVSVQVKGTMRSVSTDEKGEFHFPDIGEGPVVLIISHVGYQTMEIPVGKKRDVTVQMKLSINKLDEVQVIGYGTNTQRYSTGSVSKITSEEIEQQPVTNVLSALSGRAAGVFVQTKNGLPGGGINITIRGKGSILSGTDPLYIIDGVPFPSSVVKNASLNGSIIGEISPLNSISPSDIESISILKDADATAIYGSRASNGVVLITTKKGGSGKTKITLKLNEGVNKIANMPKLLNLKQYLNMRREAFANDGLIPSADPTSSTFAPDLRVWDTTKSTDWARYMLGGTGHLTNAEASISGGDANTNFMAGLNYHRETTILPGNSQYSRIGLHSSLQHYSNDRKFFLQISNTLSLDNNKVSNPKQLMTDVLSAPNFPLYDSSGQLNWITYNNVLADLKSLSQAKTQNLLVNGIVQFEILKGLQLRSSIGYNSIFVDQLQTFPKSSQYPSSEYVSFSYFGSNSNRSFVVEPQIEYKTNFKRSNIDILVGCTWQHSLAKGSLIYASNFNSEQMLENASSAAKFSVSNSFLEYKYASIFSRIGFNYDKRYFINVNMRRDGSSRFGPGNQFGNFGSIGTAWLFSNEKYIKDKFPVVSYGKIRASYGIVGNDQISDYQYLSTYYNPGTIYQDTITLQPSRIANSNFHWEATKKMEFGLGLGLFKDRIIVEINWFRNQSNNQLIAYTLPYITGFNKYQANLPANVVNKGWEFNVDLKPIQTKGISWSTTFNITIPKNTLKSFPGLPNTPYSKTLHLGESIDRIYGYRFMGMDSVGNSLYMNSLGDETLRPSSSTDQFYTIGSGYPVFYGGFGNSISYKNWQLDVFAQFASQFFRGGIIYRPGNQILNNYVDVENRWKKVGDNTSVPKASTKYLSPFANSSSNFFDASYIRIKNISISYSISKKLFKNMKLLPFKVYLQGQNLITIWHQNAALYDPESGAFSVRQSNLPPLKTWILGISITI